MSVSGSPSLARSAPHDVEAGHALLGDLARADHVQDGAHRLLAWSANFAGASRVSFGWWHKGYVSIPLTWGDWSCRDNDDLRRCEAAMEECIDQGVSLAWPLEPSGPAEPWVTLSQRRLSEAAGGAVACVPLPGGPEPLGAVCLEWADGVLPDPALLSALEQHLGQAALLLKWQREAQRSWHHRLRASLRRQWAQTLGQGSPRRRRSVQVLAVAALMLALWPLPDHVGGRARVEGAHQRVLVAPSDGFLQSAHVHPGDRVKANQVLADLAQQDLQREKDKWNSQLAQHENGYVGAMARADRGDAGMSLAKAEEARAQLAMVDDQLQRTRLTAPFDGVVIQGDLSQSIGAPIKQGDPLLTVASLARFRVVVDVDETDVARIRPGQAGTMALSALPWDSWRIRVVRVVPLAQGKEGRNVFEVHAEFTEALPEAVRPGLMGRARLDVGTAPWGWSLVRPLVERGRLVWWTWWG